MTDQNIPAGLTRDQAQAVREWAERARGAEVQDETVAHAARVLLAVLPPRPTLADMNEEEHEACRRMQADTDTWGRVIIIAPGRGNEIAALLDRRGNIIYEDHEQVTPRPDLPRMEWPGDTEAAPAPAPALPDGWRLADHQTRGRVIVTRPEPDDDGEVEIICPLPDEGTSADMFWCKRDRLTYIDQEADQ